MSAGAPSASDAIGLSRANLVRAIRLPRSGTASGVIPELNVILGRRLRPMGGADSIGGG